MSDTTPINQHLFDYTIALADDALILGQRLSEWCSHGPYLEEDIALANVALDYIGRASMLYQYAAQQKTENTGEKCTEDDLAFLRTEREYTNLLINELPNGDFGFTLLRQYYLDVFNNHYLQALTQSSDATLAAIATKAIKESRYHLQRSKPWIKQLTLGTEESNQRINDSREELEPYLGEMFIMLPHEQALLESGVSVDRVALLEPVQKEITEFFTSIGLPVVEITTRIKGGREGFHTEHLGHLLSEMQYLQRTYPGLEW
jgi:ring-1,2-phenylacetyl-CoA epoxidase subunit PaaC